MCSLPPPPQGPLDKILDFLYGNINTDQVVGCATIVIVVFIISLTAIKITTVVVTGGH